MRKWIALLLAATVPVASLAAQDSLKFGPEGLDPAIAETAIRRTGVMVPMRDAEGREGEAADDPAQDAL